MVVGVPLATCFVESAELEVGLAFGVEAAAVAVEPPAVELAGGLPCGTSASEGTPSGAAGAVVSAVCAGTGFEALRPRCLKRVRSRCFFFFGVGGA
jgi:hypothetical protein